MRKYRGYFCIYACHLSKVYVKVFDAVCPLNLLHSEGGFVVLFYGLYEDKTQHAASV